MIALGERIEYGSDSAIMREAADALETERRHADERLREVVEVNEALAEIWEMIANGNAFDENGILWQHVIDEAKRHYARKHNIEQYPNTTPGMAIAITLGSMLIAFIVIELIFGADDLIYWVAGLITG
jgi:hypothetical protein